MPRKIRDLKDLRQDPVSPTPDKSMLAEMFCQTDGLAAFNMEWVIDRFDPQGGCR